MWRDTARDFINVPELMLPLYAPLSRSMVEHLILIEYQPYRRAVVSSWPPREKVWDRILERVEKARQRVCKYMDTFVADDLQLVAQKKKSERTFPNDEWILRELAGYPPYVRLTKKALEDWQSRNLLRRECPPGGRWKLDDVAALLIMRICNTTHQKGWLPESIPDDEPRWHAFGKEAPDAPVQAAPIPLAGGKGSPLLFWTPRIGASWDGQWVRVSGVSVRWSRPFASAKELAVWHTIYADEIEQAAQQADEISSAALHASRQSILLTYGEMQTTLRTSIREAIERVQVAMLRKAEQLILEEQAALLVSKEK